MIYRNSVTILFIVVEVVGLDFWTGSISRPQKRTPKRRITAVNARRIVGGEEDSAGIFHFAVSLESDEPVYGQVYRVCSGSLLSASWVLTAAHCCSPAVARVRYGDARAPQNATDTFSDVLDAIPHPAFSYYAPGKVLQVNNDIGLLRVEKVPVKMKYGKLSAVDYKFILGHQVKLAGFGSTSFEPSRDTNTQLKVIDALSIKCKGVIPLTPAICVVSKCHTRKYLWRGDSGGPLLFDGKIAGVASTGQPPLLSGGYAPVSPYLDWIYSTMNTGWQK